jgi:hypothetical protein
MPVITFGSDLGHIIPSPSIAVINNVFAKTDRRLISVYTMLVGSYRDTRDVPILLATSWRSVCTVALYP